MGVEALYEVEGDRGEFVKRLQERVAWLEAVHELQSIRLSRLEQLVPEEAPNKDTLGPSKRVRKPSVSK